MSQVIDSAGNPIDPDSWPGGIVIADDGSVDYIFATHSTGTWHQKFTTDESGNISWGAWVKQP